jgi:hypothetical protein
MRRIFQLAGLCGEIEYTFEYTKGDTRAPEKARASVISFSDFYRIKLDH